MIARRARRAGALIARMPSIALITPIALIAWVALVAPIPIARAEAPGTDAPGASAPATSGESARAGTELRVGGYAQLWWVVIEQVENGLEQPVTRDEAADVASGFSVRRARLEVDGTGRGWRGRLSVRLEGSPPGLMDAYAVVPLRAGWAEIWAGQMKVPSTYEVECSSASLDLMTRSRLSEQITDFALARSPSLVSRLSGMRAYFRDLGVGLKGRLGGARYFAMIGNGLGADAFIGGIESKQEIYANRFGAYFYGLRLAYELPEAGAHRGRPIVSALAIGGHASWNDHPDVVLDDKRTVLDIRRASWSLDARAEVLGRVALTGMVGGGRVADDFDHDGRTDYRYRGGEIKAIARIVPRVLNLGLRYDVFIDETYDSGVEETRRTYTAGLACTCRPGLECRLDYKRNLLESAVAPDLADDSLIFGAQFAF
jgi:hypothetical protein